MDISFSRFVKTHQIDIVLLTLASILLGACITYLIGTPRLNALKLIVSVAVYCEAIKEVYVEWAREEYRKYNSKGRK